MSIQPSNRNQKITFSFILLFVIAVAGVIYFYLDARDLRKNPQKASQEEIAALIEKVGLLIILPKNEMPTIATVSDPEKLKDQLFFENAKTGDRVLIYSKAKKAILYNPKMNKIVEVAPISIGASAKEAVSLPAASAEKEPLIIPRP